MMHRLRFLLAGVLICCWGIESLAQVPGGQAHLTVEVPIDATVYVNGLLTKSGGTIRRFAANSLRKGSVYEFEVRAVVTRGGRQISQTKRVKLSSGGFVQFGFSFPDETPVRTSYRPVIPAEVRPLTSQTPAEPRHQAFEPGPFSEALRQLETPPVGLARDAFQEQPAENSVDWQPWKTGIPSAILAQFGSARQIVNGGADGRTVSLQLVLGEPTGVGKLEYRFDKNSPKWRPDRPFFLCEKSGRARYPSFQVQRRLVEGKPTCEVEGLIAYFLFQGTEPLHLILACDQFTFATDSADEPPRDPVRHAEMLREWWKHFRSDGDDLDGAHAMVRDYFAMMLGRRLGLDAQVSDSGMRRSPPASELENRFEKSVRMLFGIDSVLLAMQDDTLFRDSRQWEPADMPLPQALTMAAARVPDNPRDAEVEALASRVPPECLYVRLHRVANLQRMRSFLLQWGGDLREIVPVTRLDYQLRARMERQLGIGLAAAEESSFDKMISDLALVGCDLFFRDGAAFGVLFEAEDGPGLTAAIEKQREATRKSVPGCWRRDDGVRERHVSFVGTRDNQVRSFYVIDGRYHLVTNSRYIAQRFLECGAGGDSLANLKEFQYARTKITCRDNPLVFIYLSDPFFRQLVSPQYRVAMVRRGRAIAEAQQLRMARLAAQGEGQSYSNVEELVRHGFLPVSFNRRPDGSRAVLDGEFAIDSSRGLPGVFTPIPDMFPDKVTSEESRNYYAFGREYLREWRAIDPVVAAIWFREDEVAQRERVSVRIFVTPYARERYGFLTRHLAPASAVQCAPMKGDLLSLNAALQTQGGTANFVRLGLLDEAVPFRIDEGRVKPTAQFQDRTFANRNSYALITPGDEQGVELLGAFADCLQSADLGISQEPVQATPWMPLQIIFHPVSYLKSLLISNYIESKGAWKVIARSKEIRERVLTESQLEPVLQPAQVRLEMKHAGDAAVAPYLHACMYINERIASATNAQLINYAVQQFNLDPIRGRTAVENLLQARLQCPLQGDYLLSDSHGGAAYWSGSAWTKPSLFDEVTIPTGYRFRFLAWLNGLNAKFGLTTDTLTAEIELILQKTPSQPRNN